MPTRELPFSNCSDDLLFSTSRFDIWELRQAFFIFSCSLQELYLARWCWGTNTIWFLRILLWVIKLTQPVEELWWIFAEVMFYCEISPFSYFLNITYLFLAVLHGLSVVSGCGCGLRIALASLVVEHRL